MNKVGILATLQTQKAKEEEVENFLSAATPLVAAEALPARTGELFASPLQIQMVDML